MEHLSIWRRLGGWICSAIFRRDPDSRESREDNRLDVKQIQQTAMALYSRAAARIDKLEQRVDDCEDDRQSLHAKCDQIEEKHQRCEETSQEQSVHIQKLSTELQAFKQTVTESIRVNGDK